MARSFACRTADWRAHADMQLDNCWFLARYANQDYTAMTRLRCSAVKRGCLTISRFLEKEYADA